MTPQWKAARKQSGLARFERECNRKAKERGRWKLAYRVPGTPENGRWWMLYTAARDIVKKVEVA